MLKEGVRISGAANRGICNYELTYIKILRVNGLIKASWPTEPIKQSNHIPDKKKWPLDIFYVATLLFTITSTHGPQLTLGQTSISMMLV